MQTLYTYPENFRAFKALIAARYSGGDLKVVSDAPDFKFGETNKSPDFLKKFPLGKVQFVVFHSSNLCDLWVDSSCHKLARIAIMIDMHTAA